MEGNFQHPTMGGGSSKGGSSNAIANQKRKQAMLGGCGDIILDLAVVEPCVLHLCSCGGSSIHPYCDSSHVNINAERGTDYTPYQVNVEDATIIEICRCGASDKPPFCTRKALEEVATPMDPSGYSYQVDIEAAASVMCGFKKQGTVKLHQPSKGIHALAQAPERPRHTQPFVVALEESERLMFCACGQSGALPYCDSSHIAYNRKNKTDFRPFAVDINESKSLFICACGLSGNKPYCDGSHNLLTKSGTLLKNKYTVSDRGSSGSDLFPVAGLAHSMSLVDGFGDTPTELRIESIKETNPSVFYFRLALPHGTAINCDIGSDMFITFEHEGEEYERPLTPLRPRLVSDDESMSVATAEPLISGEIEYIEFYVKRYKEGALSSWLASAAVGDTWLLKGPYSCYTYQPEHMDTFFGIAAGVGILPFIQLLRQKFANPNDKTRFVLLVAARKKSDILSHDELLAYVALYPVRFSLRIILSQPVEEWKGRVGRVDEDYVAELCPAPGPRSYAGVCGPMGFVQNVAVYLRNCGYKDSRVKIFC